MMRFPILLVAATTLISGCGSRPTEGSLGTPQVNGDASAARALALTRWVLVGLGPTPITQAETARDPFITLSGEPERRLTGSGGCNAMFGSYALQGDAVKFSDIGATKMACERGMTIEASFFSVLTRVTRWRINGQQLELSDAAGTVLARLEARATK